MTDDIRPPSRRYYPTREQSQRSPLACALNKSEATEEQAIDAFFVENQRLHRDLSDALLMQARSMVIAVEDRNKAVATIGKAKDSV